MNQEASKIDAGINEEVRKLNYKVICKMEEDLYEVKYIGSYCSMYEFDKAIRIWHACDMAGPLYLITTKKGACMKMIILNQKNTTDLEEEITKEQQFELNLKDQMIFYQNAQGVVKGLWTNKTEDLNIIYNCIQEYCAR